MPLLPSSCRCSASSRQGTALLRALPSNCQPVLAIALATCCSSPRRQLCRRCHRMSLGVAIVMSSCRPSSFWNTHGRDYVQPHLRRLSLVASAGPLTSAHRLTCLEAAAFQKEMSSCCVHAPAACRCMARTSLAHSRMGAAAISAAGSPSSSRCLAWLRPFLRPPCPATASCRRSASSWLLMP